MAEIVVFHHAQGLTSGVAQFAASLAAAGHSTHAPDLYDGNVFDDLDSGIAYAQTVGFGTILERGVEAVVGLPGEAVYLGFSLGVLPAQKLAQTRPGAVGAVFVASCIPTSEFGGWPAGLPVQVHGKEADAIFVDDGDLDAARALVTEASDAELFLYPGEEHLFADPSLTAYDEPAAALLIERVLAFLARIEPATGG